MSLWKKVKSKAKSSANYVKKKAKEHIAETKQRNKEIEAMSDNQLKTKAVRVGGAYAEAWVKRKTAEKELQGRIKGK